MLNFDFDTDKTALLVIDMEKAFVEPGAAHCIAGAKVTVPTIAEAIKEARHKGLPVFWIKRQYRSDGSDVEYTRAESWEKGGRTLAPGSTGLNSEEEPEGLVRCEQDYVIIKPRWSAFFGTELDLILRRRGIDTLILTGTTTPNCIRTTCYDAISLDYKVVIPERCCSSQTEEIQRSNMRDMASIGAIIL